MYCIFIHIFSWKLNNLFVKLGTELNIHLFSQEVDIYYFPVESGHPLFSSQEVDIHYFPTRKKTSIFSSRKWTSIIFQLGSRPHLISSWKWTSIIIQQEINIHYFPTWKWTSFIFQLGSERLLLYSQEGTSIIFQQKMDIQYFPARKWISIIFSQEQDIHYLLLQLGRGHQLFSSRKWSMDTLFFSLELNIYFLFIQESNIPKILYKNYFLKWGGGDF